VKNSLFDFIDKIYQKTSGRIIVQIIIFILVLAPIIFIVVLSYTDVKKNLTDSALEKRQTIAHLASTTVYSQLDSLVELGLSLASRIQFRTNITQGKWDQAAALLESVPEDFPRIERVVLFNKEGILMADTPAAPNVKGQNFSFRDWYKGVSKNWSPYVSEVYRRTAEPVYNVIGVAIPIKTDKGEVLGVLLLQVKLDSFQTWIKSIRVGNKGYVYIVDQKGRIIVHPMHPFQGEIVDFSSVPLVQKVLHGEKGVERNFNSVDKEDRITAYESVEGFGWGVMVTEPTANVFAQRDNNLKSSLIIDGVIVFVDTLLALLVVQFLGLFNEKRVLKRIEEELRRFKLALDNTSDHVIITDTNGVILYANRSAEKLTGYSNEEIIGNRPSLWGNKMPKEFYEKMWRTIKEEKKSFEGVIKNRRKNGEGYEANIKISPVLNSSGKLLFFVGIERDITREKEIDRAKSEFVSLASHQLRTPLGITKWYLEVLQKHDYISSAPKTIQDYFNQIAKNNERVLSLVRELLSVSRIDQGRVKNSPEAVNIGELIIEVVKEMQPLAQSKKVELHLEMKQQKLPNILIDPLRFHEVIENIISNAIEYTPSLGKIDVSIDKNDNGVLIIIKDTGIGISVADQEKLFTKFYRSQKAVFSNPEGSGLGLYVVKSYVEGWGGKIAVVSTEGKGSTFSISLPFTRIKKGGDNT
jgi:PAS domain S-box-containing protein